VFAQPPADQLDAPVDALDAGAAGIDPVAAVRVAEAAEVAN